MFFLLEACETQRKPAALQSDAHRAFAVYLTLFFCATVHEKVGKSEITSSTASMKQYQLSLHWTAYREPVVVLPSGRHV